MKPTNAILFFFQFVNDYGYGVAKAALNHHTEILALGEGPIRVFSLLYLEKGYSQLAYT